MILSSLILIVSAYQSLELAMATIMAMMIAMVMTKFPTLQYQCTICECVSISAGHAL